MLISVFLRLHLELKVPLHYFALFSEFVLFFAFFSRPLLHVSVDGGWPLSIRHAENLAVVLETKLLVWVDFADTRSRVGNSLWLGPWIIGFSGNFWFFILLLYAFDWPSSHNSSTNGFVDFIKLFLPNRSLLLQHSGHFPLDLVVKGAFFAHSHVVLSAELIDEKVCKLLSCWTLSRVGWRCSWMFWVHFWQLFYYK